MDGSFSGAGKAMTATVVRQFVRSRIERQLLAQVFELVCGPRREVEKSVAAGRNAARTDRADAVEEASATSVGRRRAA